MTRKHYQIIARALGRAIALRQVTGGNVATYDMMITSFCVELHSDNPKFDPDKFRVEIETQTALEVGRLTKGAQ